MNNSKKIFSYLPYKGNDSFLFFGCTKDDETIASNVADKLVSKGFRLFVDSRGSKNEVSFEELSNALNNCDGAIIFLSKKSIELLSYRNEINNLLRLKKNIVCVKIGNFELSHGLDIQLANVPIISYTDIDDITYKLFETKVLTQDMIGQGMENRTSNKGRFYIAFSLILVSVLIFVICVTMFVNQRNSAKYLLADVDGNEYLNISQFGDEAFDILNGKSIGELDLAGGDFTSLDKVIEIKVKKINVSDISSDISLSPLCNIEGLEIVKIDQGQLQYADELCEAGLRVIVIH